jgi:hypothetical protein
MMGTHGEWFKPTQRVYSTEVDYLTPWHIGGYDEAREMMYDHLRQRGYSWE